MLQPSALPVCAQPAQTFHGISCSDRQGFLLVPPGKLEWLLLWAGLSSPGRDSDACYLPAPRTCLSSHGTQPAGPYLDLPVGLRPLTFWSILAPHVASVAKGLQELKDVGEVQLPGAVGLVPPWHLCNLDMT